VGYQAKPDAPIKTTDFNGGTNDPNNAQINAKTGQPVSNAATAHNYTRRTSAHERDHRTGRMSQLVAMTIFPLAWCWSMWVTAVAVSVSG
jgi:hypothetical protein